MIVLFVLETVILFFSESGVWDFGIQDVRLMNVGRGDYKFVEFLCVVEMVCISCLFLNLTFGICSHLLLLFAFLLV